MASALQGCNSLTRSWRPAWCNNNRRPAPWGSEQNSQTTGMRYSSVVPPPLPLLSSAHGTTLRERRAPTWSGTMTTSRSRRDSAWHGRGCGTEGITEQAQTRLNRQKNGRKPNQSKLAKPVFMSEVDMWAPMSVMLLGGIAGSATQFYPRNRVSGIKSTRWSVHQKLWFCDIYSEINQAICPRD